VERGKLSQRSVSIRPLYTALAHSAQLLHDVVYFTAFGLWQLEVEDHKGDSRGSDVEQEERVGANGPEQWEDRESGDDHHHGVDGVAGGLDQ